MCTWCLYGTSVGEHIYPVQIGFLLPSFMTTQYKSNTAPWK